jgi:surface polysaccharide O-acyltransferase-like enzyme
MTETARARPARLESAVALRALATVLVVVIHTTHWPRGAVLYDDLDLLSRLAVPAFMLLTGVLLSYQYGAAPLRTRQFLSRRFSRSLVPWLAWAPVYTVTGWFLTGDPQHSVIGVVNFVIYGAGHLWFLLLIPQMYLVYLVWPRRNLWWWAAAAMVVQTLLCIYRLYGPMPVGALEQFFLWHGFQLLPFWIGYFAVGVAAGRSLVARGEPHRVRLWPVLGAAAAAAASGWVLIAVTYGSAPHGGFAQGTGGFLLPQEPLFVISVAVLVWLTGRSVVELGGRLAAVIRVLSDNSLGIYILHPILIFAIGRQLGSLLSSGLPLSFLGFLILTVSGLIAATILATLLTATPLAPSLGARRRAISQPGRRTASSRSSAG